MSMEYSIEFIYQKYNEKCVEDGQNPVFNDKFRRIFTENFNI